MEPSGSRYEPYKRIVKFFCGMGILLMETGIYGYVWMHYYNRYMEIPYNRTGHWLMAAVYGLLLIIFNIIYGGLRVGYLRTGDMIYSQMLAGVCANCMIYLQITLLTKHFQTAVPLVGMTLIQFLLVCIWSTVSTGLYRLLYPPMRVLLIYGEHPAAGLMGKISTRNDRFRICEAVSVDLGMEEIEKRIGRYEGVVICDLPSHTRNRILKYCYGKSVRTYTTPKISDILLRSAESIHMFDTPLLLFRNMGLTFDQKIVKRMMDIALSLPAVVILLPVFAATAVAIKAYDGGPVLFRQDRCTKDGKVFSIYKFRSMVVDAEKEGRSVPATDGDPRITPVGRLIRATRIDELPQLFNILKGDMSIVGPRPERVEHVELYTREIPEFAFRMKVKGGLTGYAQVYGKYNTTAYDKLKLDLMYIQNYSVILDLKIILKTIKVLFMKESTKGFEKATSAAITRSLTEEKTESGGKDGKG